MDLAYGALSWLAWDASQKLSQLPISTRVDFRAVAPAPYRFRQNENGTSTYERIASFDMDNVRGQ